MVDEELRKLDLATANTSILAIPKQLPSKRNSLKPQRRNSTLE